MGWISNIPAEQNSGFAAHCENPPLLSLAHLKETIRALEPLKAMVTTVSEECSQQILALQEKEKVEINMLKQEKQHLLKFIDNMKEEKSSLQTQVN